MRPIGIIAIKNEALATARKIGMEIAERMNFETTDVSEAGFNTIDEWVESNDAAMVIIGIDGKTKVQKMLDMTRGLRVPYIMVKPGQKFECNSIALPVTRFLEDREKGPYCASFARYFGGKVTIYKPKDFGSAAQQNIDTICTLFDTREVQYEIVQGKKDSSGIELEASRHSSAMCIISASRDYGLDDIVFGPKERKIIKEAEMPVMVVNPRGDLYPLCD